MIKIVPDTCTLISGFLSHKNDCRKIINLALANKVALFGSKETYEEFSDKLRNHEKLKPYLIKKLFLPEKVIADYRDVIILREPDSEYKDLKILVDPEDDIFIKVAKTVDAKIIVSEDKHLRNQKIYDEVRIVNAQQFIEIYLNSNKGNLY